GRAGAGAPLVFLENMSPPGGGANWANGFSGTAGTGGPAEGAAGTISALPSAPRLTRKVCEHLVQRTLTPFSVTLSSGILKRVWQFSHLTIIEGRPGSLAIQPRAQKRRSRACSAPVTCYRRVVRRVNSGERPSRTNHDRA